MSVVARGFSYEKNFFVWIPVKLFLSEIEQQFVLRSEIN